MNARAATAELEWQPWLVRAAAIGSGSAVVLLIVPIAWLTVLGRDDGRIDDGLVFSTIGAIGILSTAGVGSFLAFRRPANAVGWLLIALGLVWGLGGLGDLYGRYGLLARDGGLPGALEAATLAQNTWPWLFALLALIVVSFPEGRPVSRGRRRIAVAAAAAGLLTCASGIAIGDDLDPPLEDYSPAFAFLGGAWQAAVFVGVCGLLAAVIAASVDIVRRLRRARGVERRQLTAFAYGALLVPASISFCFILNAVVDIGDLGVGLLLGGAIVLLPAATAVAILRYRLYAIDRIVNRTVVYGVLTALLGAAFLLLVVSLTRLFATVQDDPSPLATALATVVVTAAFLPVRARVQRAVDRRFARRRFAAVSMVEQFATRLRNDREPPERIGAVLAEALRDPGLVVAFPRLRGAELLDPYGAVAKGLPECTTTIVGPAGEPTALLLHDAVLDEDPDVLGAVTAAARLPLEIARLRVEVRGQLEDVRASRARIVAAQDAERRRVERDIHDGAQQRLVALALSLQVARRRHESGEGVDLGALLDRRPPSSAPRSRTCASSRAGCIRPCCARTGWPRRCARSPGARRFRSPSSPICRDSTRASRRLHISWLPRRSRTSCATPLRARSRSLPSTTACACA